MKKRLIYFFRRLRMNEWLIEGTERHTHAPLTIIYTGHKPGLSFVRDLAFGQTLQQKHLGKVWFFGRFSRQRLPLESALQFVEISETAATKRSVDNGFYIPMWINGLLDIENSLLLSKEVGNIKEDLRRIRKNKLEYEVTTDERRIADFHRNMYVPYIKNAFGPSALYHSLSALEKSRGTIELLVIKKDENPIAGQILVHEDAGVRTREIGVKNGDRQFVKLGAMGAIYYFGLLHLQKKGYRSVSLGGSRAWLNDGVIRFKKKWGMRLEKPWPSGLLLIAPQISEGVAAFLENNPFLSITDNQLHGVIFLRSHHDIDASEIRKLCRDYLYEGMSMLDIYPLTADSHAAAVPGDIADVVCQKKYLWQKQDS